MPTTMAPPLAPVSLADWKAAAERGAPISGLLRKAYPSEVKAEGGDSRIVRFIISTSSVDRDADTISVDGWRLDSFRKNPVVLWAHSYRDLPVGRALDVGIQDGKLMSTARFPEPGVHPFADTVLAMIRGGFLNATSVGFAPIKWAFDEERFGVDFLEQDLLEYSIVPVPANPEALVEARSAGIDLTPLKGWAERVLDEWHDQAGFWVPRSQLEGAFKILEDRTLVPVKQVAVSEEFARGLPESVATITEQLTALTAKVDALTERLESPATPPTKEPDSTEETADITEDELRELIGAAVRTALTSVTGRLD